MGGFERRMVKVGHRSRVDCEGARGLSIGHGRGEGMVNLADESFFVTNLPLRTILTGVY